jgi:hypothetical protein
MVLLGKRRRSGTTPSESDRREKEQRECGCNCDILALGDGDIVTLGDGDILVQDLID